MGNSVKRIRRIAGNLLAVLDSSGLHTTEDIEEELFSRRNGYRYNVGWIDEWNRMRQRYCDLAIE